jgi:hypothetical protein
MFSGNDKEVSAGIAQRFKIAIRDAAVAGFNQALTPAG